MPIRRINIWFGPPGSGKTTYVKRMNGFDLEVLPSRQARDQYVADGRIYYYADIGAADTQPEQYDARLCNRILVLPPRHIYDARRHHRDRLNPRKRHQPNVYDGFAANIDRYDAVLSDFPH